MRENPHRNGVEKAEITAQSRHKLPPGTVTSGGRELTDLSF